MFQGLLDQRPTPERCIEAFHLQRIAGGVGDGRAGSALSMMRVHLLG